jgi:NRPS condensation-like uncharacterized protein
MREQLSFPLPPAAEFALAVESDEYPKTDYSQLQFRGPLNTQAFAEAFNELIANFPIANCVIEQRREGRSFHAYWVPTGHRTNHLIVQDCRHMMPEPPDPVEFIQEFHAARTRRRLDLYTEHPIQFYLLRIADDVHLLSIVYHHIAVDAAMGYEFIKDVLARYHEKVTGKKADWAATPSIGSQLRETNYATPQPAWRFIREQLVDLFLSSRGRVSQIASNGTRDALGRFCFRAIFDPKAAPAGMKAIAKRNDATLGDVIGASIARSIGAWDREHGIKEDKIRGLLAVNIRNRIAVEGAIGVALSGIMVRLTRPEGMSADEAVWVFRDTRKDQLTRGVDIAYHKMLETLSTSMRALPVGLRGTVARKVLAVPVTFILSNIGVMWPKVEAGKLTGKSAVTRVGGFEIDDIHSCPSMSPDVGMGIITRTLGERFFINYSCDRLRFEKDEARALTDRITADLAAMEGAK